MLAKQTITALLGSALMLAMGAPLTIAADTSPSTTTAPNANVNTEPGSKGKTSDRTPGNPTPDRTPNASTTGNVGTDAGQTHEGTSDRTPNKDSAPKK